MQIWGGRGIGDRGEGGGGRIEQKKGKLEIETKEYDEGEGRKGEIKGGGGSSIYCHHESINV